MENVIVVTEWDHQDRETEVIGVIDSLDKVDYLINVYYGVLKYRVIESFKDPGTDRRVLTILSDEGKEHDYNVTIDTEGFTIIDKQPIL